MSYINLTKIEIRKGDGKYPFKCVAIFNNNNEWVVRMPELEKLCEGLSICEDKKFPNGLGRNMFFLAHLFDIYREYFKKNNLVLNENDYNFAMNFKIKTEIKIEDKSGDENGTC